MKSSGTAALMAVFVLSVGTLNALGGAAQAQTYGAPPPPPPPPYHHHHHHYRHYDNGCHEARRSSANTGTAVGAVSGGILGSALGGGRFGNVLLGAGAGAVAGHEIGKHSVRC
jgi:hypothetical protein